MAGERQLMRLFGATRRSAPMLSEDVIRAMRAAADPVDLAIEQRRLDKLMGRDVYDGPSFEGIDLPEDTIAPMVGATGAPRSWMERAAFEEPITSALRDNELPPLLDMLRDAEKSQALVAGRLDRMSPEQQAASLPYVALKAERDTNDVAAALRAAMPEAAARNQLAALTALGAAGLGGAGLMKAYEEGAFDEPPVMDLSGDIEDFSLPPVDVGEEPVGMHIDFPMGVEDLLEAYPLIEGLTYEDEPQVTFSPSTPDEAIRMKPGPGGVRRRPTR